MSCILGNKCAPVITKKKTGKKKSFAFIIKCPVAVKFRGKDAHYDFHTQVHL